MKAKELTIEQKELMKKLYREGKGSKTIAGATGIGRSRVIRCLKSMGVWEGNRKYTTRGNHSIPEEKVRAICEDRRRGMSIYRIMRTYKVSRCGVNGILERNGLKDAPDDCFTEEQLPPEEIEARAKAVKEESLRRKRGEIGPQISPEYSAPVCPVLIPKTRQSMCSNYRGI